MSILQPGSGAALAKLRAEIIKVGLCTGCGLCVGLDRSGHSYMEDTAEGPQPQFEGQPDFTADPFSACPARGLNYPELHQRVYGSLPENWLTGPSITVRTGHAADETIRRNGASGGVLTRVLIHLLEEKLVDAVVVVRQGLPTAEKARAVFAATREEVLAAAQSVYIPVAMLDKLREFEPGKRYAMTCLPDQAAALRRLQMDGHPQAQQVLYVLGPYTGTAMYPAAIHSFLRSARVRDDDPVIKLQWRAGDWPGYLEIKTASGRVLRSSKFYYNYLIPFFITRNSLLNMDFANEFCDLSVGDAWSPRFEQAGGGHSVITTRTQKMEDVLRDMTMAGHIAASPMDALKATEMHGHMIDFKKRGGYLRNRMRRALGRPAMDFGMRPEPLPASRMLVELVISGLFLLAGTRPSRWLISHVPGSLIGPLFNRTRLAWKSLSKPTKRKGLGSLRMIPTSAVPE